jgi:purine-nucleoside phosphorylase
MYGIYLSIHPSVKNKYVMIHQESCPSFRQNKKTAKNIYTFNKKEKTLRKAVETASEYSLEWHARIWICEKCFPRKNKVECTF